eukprot:TRINITY_DN14967_c0_g1_i1.p1 TRINITY_DN14967_c0_g1~~TRINITY_DN14967_c0_g1_i1.p1  ORF type:complete len:229 (-),score=43.87 TRINITY_DN14967_c0_g1_i1:351-1037(-)
MNVQVISPESHPVHCFLRSEARSDFVHISSCGAVDSQLWLRVHQIVDTECCVATYPAGSAALQRDISTANAFGVEFYRISKHSDAATELQSVGSRGENACGHFWSRCELMAKAADADSSWIEEEDFGNDPICESMFVMLLAVARADDSDPDVTEDDLMSAALCAAWLSLHWQTISDSMQLLDHILGLCTGAQRVLMLGFTRFDQSVARWQLPSAMVYDHMVSTPSIVP